MFARAEARDAYPQGKALAAHANDPNETQIQYDLYRIPFNDGPGRRARADRRRFAERHEQQLPQGLARRALHRLRAGQQRPADAPRRKAVHRPGRGRRGAPHAREHAAHELLAQLLPQRPLAGVLLQEPLALHPDVPHARRRARQRHAGHPRREQHGRQPRGEHPGVREHPARRPAEDRRAGHRVLPSHRRGGGGDERGTARGGHPAAGEGPGVEPGRRGGPQQPRVGAGGDGPPARRGRPVPQGHRAEPGLPDGAQQPGVGPGRQRQAGRSDRRVQEGPGPESRLHGGALGAGRRARSKREEWTRPFRTC